MPRVGNVTSLMIIMGINGQDRDFDIKCNYNGDGILGR